MIAAAFALRVEGLPFMDFWDFILKSLGLQPIQMDFAEDNEAMIKICRNAGSQRLRHTSRTHRVNTNFIAEQFQANTHICLYAVQSADQAADIYTKRFIDPIKWFQLLYLNNIVDTFCLLESAYI